MGKCRAPFQACNCVVVLFQVDVICPYNDLMFSTIAYSDVLPFGVPGLWQNQGLSFFYFTLILPASRAMFLGACLLSTFGYRDNEERLCFPVISLYIGACKQKTP